MRSSDAHSVAPRLARHAIVHAERVLLDALEDGVAVRVVLEVLVDPVPVLYGPARSEEGANPWTGRTRNANPWTGRAPNPAMPPHIPKHAGWLRP